MRELLSSRGALIGFLIVLGFALLALFAPLVAPHDPAQINSGQFQVPPFWSQGAVSGYMLGTDDLGRDLFSRLVYGARVSLMTGLMVVVFATAVGTALGLLAGYFGGWVDTVIMRVMDILMALPSILLAIVVVTILGQSLTNAVLAVGITILPGFVRVVRAQVTAEKSKAYVVATRSFGAGHFRLAVDTILPNCLAPLIVLATLGFSDAILNVAALGFLGLGAKPPTPEWGTMLADAQAYIESAPRLVTLPGLCILIVVLAFNILGDGLRDALDPRLKK